MAEVREPGGLGYKVITILGILFFVVVVAALIRTYNNDSEVAAVAPAVTTPAPTGSVETATQAPPVGAVATGGGGMAGDGAGTAIPVFLGLFALTVLAAGGIVVRWRRA